MTTTSSLRTVAISGMGRMGLRHVQAAQSAGLHVVGVSDLDPHATARAAKDLCLPPQALFSDFETMLTETKPDALVVASTANGHFDACMRGMNAGVSVILCEKPFVSSVGQAEILAARASTEGVRLAINHQTRHTTRFQMLRALLSGEVCGHLTSLTVSTGNIGLAMGASHYIELFRLLAGAPIIGVRFLADPPRDPNPRGGAFHDLAGRLMVDTFNGPRLFIDFGAESGHGMTSVFSTDVGRIIMDDISGRTLLDVRTPRGRGAARTRYAMPSVRGEMHIPIEDPVASTTHVWESLLADGDYCSADEATVIVRVLAAAESSASQGGARIDPTDAALSEMIFPWA
jgi:predicted dehydrogenase